MALDTRRNNDFKRAIARRFHQRQKMRNKKPVFRGQEKESLPSFPQLRAAYRLPSPPAPITSRSHDRWIWPMSNAIVPAIICFVLAAAISAGLIVILYPLLTRYALAKPNTRSSHQSPTPQGGGIAVVVATLAVASLALYFFQRRICLPGRYSPSGWP